MPRNLVTAVWVMMPLWAISETSNWDRNYAAGLAAYDDGCYSDAVAPLSAAVEQAKAFHEPDVRYVQSTHTLALVYHAQGRFDLAEQLFLEARRTVEAMGAQGRPLLGYVLDGLGDMLLDQGRWQEAEPLLRQAIALCGATHGAAHPCTLTATRHLGELMTAQESKEAEALFQNLIATARQARSLPKDFLATSLGNLASYYVASGRYEPAERLLKESL